MEMISIIVPIFNEANNIKKFIKNLNKLNFNYELIFVDDCSTDKSYSIIKKIKTKKIKYILRKQLIRDLSKSVLLGIKKARFDYVLVLDCDLQHDLTDANYMLKILLKEKVDLVIGSRFLKKKYSGNLKFFRSVSSLLFILIINLLFKKKTSDPLSGYFLSKKKFILENQSNYYSKGYKILFDILYNSKKIVKTKDYQINFKKRYAGKSKLNKKVVLFFLNQIIYTFFNSL